MPFRSKGRSYYKTRITLPDDRCIVAGCGTDDLPTARAIEQMLKRFRAKREWRPMTMIVERKVSLAQVYDAYESGALSELLDRVSAPDLAQLLDEWSGNPKYKTQIRRMVGVTFPSHNFTRRRISEFLSRLPVSGSTKNRYRAALSVFSRWLVEREILETNPVRDVRGAKPNAARMVWLDRGQAKTLIAALDNPYRAIESLMAATGVEWQVIERLVRRDVDLDARTLHARGGKTPWRNRTVRAMEGWAWTIFAEYVRDFTPNALIFPGVREDAALRVHKRAAKLLNLPHTTLHDWRHTFAVQGLRDGRNPQAIATNLGHRDTYLLLTRYGRHVPNARDYEAGVTHAAVPDFQAVGRED